jgi:adenine deaminase
MLSSCVPATSLETNGGGSLSALDLQPFVGHENVLGLAEVMNVPAVLMEDAEMMAKLKLMPQSRKDGHAPLLRGLQLSAYACAGITSCHESSEEEEAVEKIRKGMAVWIREGSVAKDLASLVRLIDPYRSAAVGFCTDDRNPLDVAQEGHLDFLIRKAIRLGAPVEAVYRASSWSVARHYGLLDRGAISPGMRADLVVLDDLNECRVNSVFQQGRLTSELEFDPSLCASRTFENSIVANVPTEQELKGPEGRVHVMEIIAGKIITDRSVRDSNERGVHAMTVLERYGNGHPPSNAYVRGFGETFQGAIASSVGHDSHNLAVVGSNPSDMKVALSHLIESGGGFCVVQNSKILADLLLPYAGLMTARPLPEVTQKLRNLREASRRIGCVLEEPFLQLAFLCLPVIPSLKLTDRGLVDVNQFQIIPVRA